MLELLSYEDSKLSWQVDSGFFFIIEYVNYSSF